MANPTIAHLATVFLIDAAALKDNKNWHRRRSIIREFSLNTTAHGFGGIVRSESIPNRIFWSICTVAFIGIMFYFVTQTIRDYFDYPTQTSVAIVVEWPQFFPAFTICNSSPVRFDRFTNKINHNESLNDFMFPLSSMRIKMSIQWI
jgi:hypothetical protein